jgi:hypothetical protein
MRMNRSDPGLDGFLIIIAFAVSGIIGLPLYRLFLAGAVGFGLVVACLLYFVRKTKKNSSGVFPLDLSSDQTTSSEVVDAGDQQPGNHRLEVVPVFVGLH